MKIIATDVDGTLVDSELQVSLENKKIIKAINALGKHVVIATGRSHLGAIEFFKNQGIECAKICSNGAVIVDEQGNIIESSPANIKIIQRYVQILTEYNVYFELATNYGSVMQDFSRRENYMKDLEAAGHIQSGEYFWKVISERVEEGTLKLVDSYDEIFSIEETEVYKIFAISENRVLLEQLRTKLCADSELCITSSWSNNLEINGKGVSKGNAIKAYAEKLGYDVSDVMAIGDSYNDVSMFEAAGLAVAMGNAPKDVQELCDWVTGTNDENGWADAAQKFMIDEKVAVGK